ncbi:MAG TPA: amidohydrolase, partial [Symbiobacteriaceae bacterium]|nr:amidohydrolase [Symbiobacteriaceae bacterium]
AVIDGGRPGRTVALRADMDALPIAEETGLPFASENPGVMHACGHDVHTATLLATARALKQIEADLPGRVVLIFQPGEEVNPGGASLMIRDGVLQNPAVDAIFGLHVYPLAEAGTMAFGAGPMLAAPDEFDVTIVGRGGHGAQPHLCVDPVLVAAQCLTLLQQIVARNVGPFQSAVITVGSIHGGTARNVIPDEVTFKGTVRTMDSAVQALMRERITAVIRGVCDAAGASYRLRYDPGYPALVNDAAATDLARRAALHVLDEAAVQPMGPSMGGEDFAFYLQQVPGSFARLGSMAPGTVGPAGLHTAKLMIDEECMAVGAAYYLSVVQTYLGQD